MSDDRNDLAFRELVASVVDGTASTDECAALEQRLLASPAARDFYLDYVNLHSALRRRFLSPADEAAAEMADFRRAAMADLYPAARSRRTWPALVAMCATVVALAFVLISWQSGWWPGNAQPLATVRQVSGQVTLIGLHESRAAKIGDVLRHGESLRVGSEAAAAMIEYRDGTQVRIHDASVVQAPSAGEVRLQLLSGSIEVDAAKQPPNRPLVIATEHSRYVVLGTRFRLYCEPEASRLELDEGRVRLERPSGGEAVEVTAGQMAIAASDTAAVTIRPLAAGRAELVQSLRHGGQAVAFSADNLRLFTSNRDSGLQVWSPTGEAAMHEHRRDPGASDGLAFDEQTSTLVQANRNGYVLAWRVGSDKAMKLPLRGRHTRSRALSPDGTFVAESSEDGTKVYEIDLAARKLHERFAMHEPGKAWCMALSHGGERLAAGFWDGTTRVCDVATGEVVFDVRLAHTPISIDISPDGRRLVVFTQRDGLKLIDIATGQQQSLWPAGTEIVRCARFTPNGERVIAGLHDRTARMWAVEDARPLIVVDAGHSPQSIAWSQAEQLLVTADGTVKIWRCTFDPPAIAAASTPKNDAEK